MERIRRFLNCFVPIYKCNLSCTYCYLTQNGKKDMDCEEFPYSPRKIAEALTPGRVGGTCLINLCASGETLLGKKIVKLTELLLEEGHYVSIVTNLTIRNSVEALCVLENKEKLFVKASFHYLQLKEKGLLDTFFENIGLLKDNDVAYTIEIVADDNIADKFEEISQIVKAYGEALPHVLECRIDSQEDIPRLEIDKEHYEKWAKYNSDLFFAQQSIWGKKITDFCYAGDLSAEINLATGDMTQCACGRPIQNIYNDHEKLRFSAIGSNCMLPHCYISYAWQGLCGNVRSIKYPSYTQLRDRNRLDGTDCLNTTIRNVFSHKCIDEIQLYSNKKQKFLDILWRVYHNSTYIIENDERMLIGDVIENYLHNNKLIIYGYGKIGKLVAESYKGNGTVTICDKNYKALNLSNKNVIVSPDAIKEISNIDEYSILITTIVEGELIKNSLKGVSNKVYTVFDLIDEIDR